MPSLPDYPVVSQIQTESPGLPYGWPNLLDSKESAFKKYMFSRTFLPIFGEKIQAFLQFLLHFDGGEESIVM